MAFPFWWIGALTAALVLGATFVAFGIAIRLVSRTTGEIRGSMLPGLVSGFRTWAEARESRAASSGDSPDASGPATMEERPDSPPVTEPVRRR